MKNKIMSLISATALLSVATFSVASAQGLSAGSANANVKAQVQVGLNAQGGERGNSNASTSERSNATSTAAQVAVRGNATSTAARDGSGNATGTEANANGQLTAAAHRSAVATLVRTLLEVADREGGIGAQVRVIAQAQSNAASTSAEAITKVENRSTLQTILFGSDDKSLGTLRSEIAVTQNNITQLKNLVGKATSATDKAELAAQIQVLENSQVQMDAFVKAHESTFSIFGWFTKLFGN